MPDNITNNHNHQQAPFPPLHPNINIQPPTPSLLPAYKRLITNLLPIPYPPQFYTASLPPFSNSFALLAVWRSDTPPTSTTTTSTTQSLTSRPSSSSSPGQRQRQQQQQQSEVVIGGIQGRIEHQSSSSSSSSSSTSTFTSTSNSNSGSNSSAKSEEERGGNNNNNGKDDGGGGGRKVLYIQTLAVLAPYRGLGVGKALLEGLIEMVLKQEGENDDDDDESGGGGGGVVVREVYAHVWEANEEGVEWYVKRGFAVVGGVVESYYRRLRPQGARVVRRRVGVGDWVRAGGLNKGG